MSYSVTRACLIKLDLPHLSLYIPASRHSPSYSIQINIANKDKKEAF